MSSTKRKWMAITAVTVAAVGPQLTPATASADLHNVTYIARIDGVAPGGQATFRIHDNETSSTGLSSVPGNAFEANTVLADPSKAGMQVSVPWPYSANVHCEIDVDDNVAAQVDQSIGLTLANNDPNRVVSCGAPLT
ncbi:hypothetical protein MFM001_43320 [Mycobacterium sp. MFM001]|uniref:hypothetical protein n=1 Tax=Mycobacterium sp. MFM001 TaxID=2049453 RepID=UPI000DA4CD94|nr:hypothetical protein [Mycobacterium sp. MFM001]GBE67870.1 hypothetical protein MFM001_43320 [Mycobacterium sp. MFM001]